MDGPYAFKFSHHDLKGSELQGIILLKGEGLLAVILLSAYSWFVTSVETSVV